MYRRTHLTKQLLLARNHNGRNAYPSITTRATTTTSKPIIAIQNGTFYKNHIPQTSTSSTSNESNPPLFHDLTFTLSSNPSSGTSKPETWAILSPSALARTQFLQILAGRYLSSPPNARTYPSLTRTPAQAIAYVGFDAERTSSSAGGGGGSTRGAYLSSRYEARREETDFTLEAYLRGEMELNALSRDRDEVFEGVFSEAVELLRLGNLLGLSVSSLSNGQMRRARIARAVLGRPEVLLLDGVFMGLDPGSVERIGGVLGQLAERGQPRIVVSLRPEEGVPTWVSHCVAIEKNGLVMEIGKKEEVLAKSSDINGAIESEVGGGEEDEELSRDYFPKHSPALPPGEVLVEISGAKVSYGSTTVLGDWAPTSDTSEPGLHWRLHRGQRAGIFGPNGSGKTTMLSLITSDHPQTYSQPVKLFGRARLPAAGEPGISLFDIQQRMGHSSPEVHAFFPKNLSVRRALLSAWADAPMAKPKVDAEAETRVDAFLRWFERELRGEHEGDCEDTVLEQVQDAFVDPRFVAMIESLPSESPQAAEEKRQLLETDARAIEQYKRVKRDGSDVQWAAEQRFGELSFSAQRLLLFLRAIIKSPDLVILDEALSGVDEETRDKALLFLSHGEKIQRSCGINVARTSVEQLGEVSFPGLSERQALLVISHSREDVPGCIRDWICLPEAGEGKEPRTGRLDGPLELNPNGWDEIWGRAR